MFHVVRAARWRPPSAHRWEPVPDLVGGTASGLDRPDHVVLLARDAAAAQAAAHHHDVLLDADDGSRLLVSNARFQIVVDDDGDLLLVLDGADAIEPYPAARRRPDRPGRRAR